MDTPTLINSKDVFDHLYFSAKRAEADFLGFHTELEQGYEYFETGLFYAPENSTLVREWLSELEYMFSMGISKYIYHARREGVFIPPTLFHPYPVVDSYFAVYACGSVAIQRKIPRRTKLLSYSVTDYFYQMITDCRWNRKCVRRKTFSEQEREVYSVIKYNWPARLWVDPEYVKTFGSVENRKVIQRERSVPKDLSVASQLHTFFYIPTSFVLITSMASVGRKLTLFLFTKKHKP